MNITTIIKKSINKFIPIHEPDSIQIIEEIIKTVSLYIRLSRIVVGCVSRCCKHDCFDHEEEIKSSGSKVFEIARQFVGHMGVARGGAARCRWGRIDLTCCEVCCLWVRISSGSSWTDR